ncbi:hypothetical protein C8J34_105204 [Rhizobium sp. PP-F2F-G36]|nr:hypothetical protein C8J34_105204 [Rhizobium sp. PP-F2F-G36]
MNDMEQWQLDALVEAVAEVVAHRLKNNSKALDRDTGSVPEKPKRADEKGIKPYKSLERYSREWCIEKKAELAKLNKQMNLEIRLAEESAKAKIRNARRAAQKARLN